MKETKTQQAIRLLAGGDIKEALKVFKTFRLGWSKDEKRIIDIACECLCGKAPFYSSLGIDCEKVVEDAVVLARSKYLRESIS